MPRHPSFQLARILIAGAVLAGAGARAAELGDAKVNSYLGQQLSADIELTTLHDANGTVQVRVASLDVYRGAGLELPAVLSSVNLAVVRRDGKQFLHLTSTRPIEADHLHLYLELSDGGQRGVRLATLWFAPDPAPPASRVVVAPLAAAPVVQPLPPARPRPPSHQKLVRPLPAPAAAKEEAKPAPVQSKLAPADPKPPKAVATEPKRAVTAAPTEKPAQTASAKAEPAKPAQPKREAAATPVAEPAKQAAPGKPAVVPDQPKPAPLALAAAKAGQAHPAAIPLPQPVPACPKTASQAENACSSLDGKNAELRAELVKLEERVKTLQAEAQARAEAAAKAAAAPKPPVQTKPAKPIKASAAERPAADDTFGQVMDEPPTPAPVFKPVKLKAVVPAPPPARPEEQAEGMPWGWIAGTGGGVFAIIGGLQFWRYRRRQARVHRVHAPLPDTDDEMAEPTFV